MGLFNKKKRKDKLYSQYCLKLEQAHKMSAINRTLSDQLMYEAHQLLIRIENEA